MINVTVINIKTIGKYILIVISLIVIVCTIKFCKRKDAHKK